MALAGFFWSAFIENGESCMSRVVETPGREVSSELELPQGGMDSLFSGSLVESIKGVYFAIYFKWHSLPTGWFGESFIRRSPLMGCPPEGISIVEGALQKILECFGKEWNLSLLESSMLTRGCFLKRVQINRLTNVLTQLVLRSELHDWLLSRLIEN